MNLVYDRTDDVEYEQINKAILDGNIYNISLVISE